MRMCVCGCVCKYITSPVKRLYQITPPIECFFTQYQIKQNSSHATSSVKTFPGPRVCASCVFVFVLVSCLFGYGHLSFQGHTQDFSLRASSSRHGAWLNLSLSLQSQVKQEKRRTSPPISCLIYRRWGWIDDQSANRSSEYNQSCLLGCSSSCVISLIKPSGRAA